MEKLIKSISFFREAIMAEEDQNFKNLKAEYCCRIITK